MKESKTDNKNKFKIEFDKIREGYYSDEYFAGVRTILEKLSEEKYKYSGASPYKFLPQEILSGIEVGDLEADMQIFTKRKPFTITAGTEYVREIVTECTGSFETKSGKIKRSEQPVKVFSVEEGEKVESWQPVMRISGKYREYATLETVILGILSRASLIATNTYNFLQASNGKPILFFPARFDFYLNQELDGYAYKIGIDAYKKYTGISVDPLISTAAQGAWWDGGRWGGAMSHSYLVCFLRDTAEAALQFARCAPPDYKRIVLVDINNDTISDGLASAKAMFAKYLENIEKGNEPEAMKYKLFAVRLDTSMNLRDVNVTPLGNQDLDCGVNPRLVFMTRQAFDQAPEQMNLPLRSLEIARKYFREIKIVVSGGFDMEKIRLFENLRVPADIYSVGTSFLSIGENNYTADLVRIKINNKWYPIAKEGRQVKENDKLFTE